MSASILRKANTTMGPPNLDHQIAYVVINFCVLMIITKEKIKKTMVLMKNMLMAMRRTLSEAQPSPPLLRQHLQGATPPGQHSHDQNPI